jgi:hypothetical protein
VPGAGCEPALAKRVIVVDRAHRYPRFVGVSSGANRQSRRLILGGLAPC